MSYCVGEAGKTVVLESEQSSSVIADHPVTKVQLKEVQSEDKADKKESDSDSSSSSSSSSDSESKLKSRTEKTSNKKKQKKKNRKKHRKDKKKTSTTDEDKLLKVRFIFDFSNMYFISVLILTF